MIVTISGLAGSGKTSVAKLIAKEKGMTYVSASIVFRDYAKEKNMTLTEFGEYVMAHPEVDDEIDQRQLALARAGNVVLEGRLSGWMTHREQVPALRIWLDASLETRVHRIVGREKKSYQTALRETEERESCEIARYKTHYGIDLHDRSIYTLDIDTEPRTRDAVVQHILDYMAA